MYRRSGGIKIECTKELFDMLSGKKKKKIANQYDQTVAQEQVRILYHRHQDCFFSYHLRWHRFLLWFLEQAQKRRLD